jgi:DNA-binding NarL/FixJ family response regulator
MARTSTTSSTTTGRGRGRTLTAAHTGRTTPTATKTMETGMGAGRGRDVQDVRSRAAVALREAGLSQQQIADKLGYSLNTIRHDLNQQTAAR